MMPIYEATQDIHIEPLEVETPLTTMTGAKAVEKVGLVPIYALGWGWWMALGG